MRSMGFVAMILVLALSVILTRAFPLQSQPAKVTEYKVIVGAYSGFGTEPIRAGVQNTLTEEAKVGWELAQAIPLPSPFTANIMLILKR